MRDKHVSYFHGAVLLALGVPACGGKVLDTSTDAGGVDASDSREDGATIGVDASDGGADGATCDWVPETHAMCNWSFVAGNPTCRVDFSGPCQTGTPAQCLAVCGKNAAGQAPDVCSVGTVSASDGGGRLGLWCVVTSGPCAGPSIQPCNGGRRPDYFASLGFGEAPRGRELGTHFARVACMEAGSVEAFRLLRDELVAHGAPERLVRAARRAIRDELRHVRQTAALARRFGEPPIAPLPMPARQVRPLLQMAFENAVEGCVRETYSALECAWQAECAWDPVVRTVMKRIARDEMQHLALAWAVDAWAISRLDRDSARQVREAQRIETTKLRGEVRQDPHESLVRQAGLPRAPKARALISAIESRLAA
jgi:hypothetical protein